LVPEPRLLSCAGLLVSGRLLKQNSSLLQEEVGSTVGDPGEIDLIRNHLARSLFACDILRKLLRPLHGRNRLLLA
jgi:hypothetical protein